MDFAIIILALIGFGIYQLKKLKKPVQKRISKSFSNTSDGPKKNRVRNAEVENFPSWLVDRWKTIDERNQTNQPNIVPKWYFDEASPAQLSLLQQQKIRAFPANITKGKASDLIGLHAEAETKELEILKFFKVPTKSVKQTQARHVIATLFLQPENKDAWNNRPPTTLQKAGLKFFKIKAPESMTATAVENLINNHIKTLNEDDLTWSTWSAIESLYEELSDKETRENFGIKKPSINLLVRTVQQLVKEGKKPAALELDIDAVVERLIETEPEIEL